VEVIGAQSNNLAVNGQGICEVEIDFAHDFISDLEISLTSPAGQTVPLISSPANNDTTYFSRWKIKINRCGDPVSPDPGFAPNFEDNANWPNNTTFTGSYHHNLLQANDCLESINIGPVNGTWLLKVTSNGHRGVGYIYGFKIKFCNSSGIICSGLNYESFGGESCDIAAPLPANVNTFVGNTGYNADYAVGFCGSIENDQWFSFVSACNLMSVTITPGYCFNGAGLQLAVYEDCNSLPLDCLEGCNSCGWQPQSLVFPTVPGEEYYILIDGYAGDWCDFIFEIPPQCIGGVGDPDFEEFNPNGCQNTSIGVALNKIPFGAAGYIWKATNGALVNGQTQVTIPGPGNLSVELTFGNGDGQVCVAAYNFTDTSAFVCLPFTADTNLFLVENATVCYTEYPYISEYYDYGVPLLSFPGTRQFYLSNYVGDDGYVYPCPVLLTIHLETEGAFSTLPPVVALGTAYTFPDGQMVNSSGLYVWSEDLISGCVNDYAQRVYLIDYLTDSDGCAPDTVTFIMPGGVTLECPGAVPSMISGSGAQKVVYHNAGVYDLIGKIGGQTFLFEDTLVLDFNAPPIANFTTTVTQNELTVNNVSSDATSFLWNFGDGTTSTETNPTHTYAAPASYTVTLTAFGLCPGTIQTTVVVIEGELPLAAFQISQNEGCSPFTVQFTDHSIGQPTAWNWDFPGGDPSTSTAENPIVTYESPGAYSATLTIENVFGQNTSVQNAILTIHPPTIADFTTNTTLNVVTLSNLSQNATGYLWDFGDGFISTETSPTHIYNSPGEYSITLVANGLCGPSTSSMLVNIVAPAPQAAFQVSQNMGCVPFTVQYQDNSMGNPNAWNWAFPGGNPTTSTEQNPSITYSVSGTYSATLMVQNGFGQSTLSQNTIITAHPLPEAYFAVVVNENQIVLENNSVHTTSYFWDFGDGFTSDEVAPTHVYATPGEYLITLIANGVCGNSAVAQILNISGQAPQAAFQVSPAVGCVPMIVQYQDLSGGNPSAWFWQFPGGLPDTSTAQNPSIIYLTPGTYDATLSVQNAFGDSTLLQTAIVSASPLPTVLYTMVPTGLEVAFTNLSQEADSYAWDFGDGNTSSEANPTHVYAGPGEYLVTLQATNTCGTSILQLWVNVMVSSNFQPPSFAWLRVSPNPSDGYFYLEIRDKPSQKLSWRLFNALGQSLEARNLGAFSGEYAEILDMRHLPPSLYWLEVQSAEKRSWLKLVIE
jgi:PKD repeat protein